MATPKTPVPAAPQAGLSANSIADAGAGLIRLWVAAITLPLTTANALGTGFARLITSLTAALDGKPVQSNNEIVQATSNLISATTGLYLAVLNAAVGSLDAATRAVNEAVKDAGAPRK
jgi:tetrahydromethanopterin S-methyltransferase subunit C